MTITYTTDERGNAVPHGPQITITIDTSKGFNNGSVREALDELDEYLLRNAAPPAPCTVNDEYGTRLDLMSMPDTYDTNDGASRYMDQHFVSNMSMLAMRMRWGAFAARDERTIGMPFTPFDHLTIHRGKDKVYVFLVHNGLPVTMEDDPALFPSDSLCTRLRMLSPDEKY